MSGPRTMLRPIRYAAILPLLMVWALFRIGPADPVTFLGIGVLMGAVALVACGVPALAAARVDPLESLRSE